MRLDQGAELRLDLVSIEIEVNATLRQDVVRILQRVHFHRRSRCPRCSCAGVRGCAAGGLSWRYTSVIDASSIFHRLARTSGEHYCQQNGSDQTFIHYYSPYFQAVNNVQPYVTLKSHDVIIMTNYHLLPSFSSPLAPKLARVRHHQTRSALV